MFKSFKPKELQELSKKYIRDNELAVRDANQRMMLSVSTMYFIIVTLYNVIVPIFFASWHVTWIYQIAWVEHLFVLTIMILRYRKTPRPEKEVRYVAAAFQFYCMLFVFVVSVLPFDMDQPAMYFAPIMIGFSALFIFTYYLSAGIIIIETISLIIVSVLFKSSEVSSVNVFAAILSAFVAIFIISILYSNRASESKHRKQLRKVGNTDKLTGIHNRAYSEMLASTFMRENRTARFALMIIDVDFFKSVNDTYGHQTGDVVLQEVAKILEQAAGHLNIVGRMGGDEFIIFVKNWREHSDIDQIADQILRHVSSIKLPDDRVHISSSIGICALEESEWMEFDEMFSCADQALYEVKESGKNNKRYFKAQ